MSVSKIKEKKVFPTTVDGEYNFLSSEIKEKYMQVCRSCGTERYIYTIDGKVVAFANLLNENLLCGFMHYHIPGKYLNFFESKFPVLAQKTNQLHYIYTESTMRCRGIATALLQYILNDLHKAEFRFVWLKKETHSSFYYHLGFCSFLEALNKLSLDFTSFQCEYENYISSMGNIVNRFGDERLIKVL